MEKRFGLLGLLFLFVFISGSFYYQLNREPSRTVKVSLPSVGEVTAVLTTQPDPPKTGGIPLTVRLTDSAGRPVTVDKAVFKYAKKDAEAAVAEGQALSAGTYQAIARLSSVGEWTVEVILTSDGRDTTAHFDLRVMPNI